MPVVRDYSGLLSWQKAMTLVEEVYRLTRQFPKEERYGFCSQIRRCAVSIPSNIAEGQGRDSVREFVRFLSIARVSVQELQTQLLLAERLQFVDSTQIKKVTDLSHEVCRLVSALSKSIRGTTRHPRNTNETDN